MSQKLVRVDSNRHIATVTLNRPELHNAFNDDMIAELSQIFLDLGKNQDIRAIILAGEGKSFSAGADLNWMKSMLKYTYYENVEDARKLAHMLKFINECPKPVIGRIHGAAFGGGVGLVSVCDMTVALDSAMFCFSEVRLGLVPAVISPFVLQKMPPAQARRYFLTAERFTAREAARIGLISVVVSTEEELDSAIKNWTDTLCINGPEAVSMCKRFIREVSVISNLSDIINMAATRIAERRVSEEGQEGMSAYLEKRPAKWLQSESASHVS